MFNMGGGELALVALVALLIIGPKKLPEVATKLGRWVHQFQKGFEEIKSTVKESLNNEEQIEQNKSQPKPRLADPRPPSEISKKDETENKS